MKALWLVAGAAMISAAGAAAQDSTEAEGSPEDQVIQCRYERVTGSRTKAYRVCLTKAEWNRRTVDEREELEKLRGTTQQGPGAGF